jgi:hypothetical protein
LCLYSLWTSSASIHAMPILILHKERMGKEIDCA